jgi:NitT/TauT family transport system permease protein
MPRRLLNLSPRGGTRMTLGLLPLIAAVLLYFGGAAAERISGPDGHRLPTPAAMAAAVAGLAVAEPDTGLSPLVRDSVASVSRITAGLTLAAVFALGGGLAVGLLPLARAGLGPTIAVLTAVPPLAALPILLIGWGPGEGARMALIVLGITPLMIRDLARHVAAIPAEQIVKAQTLGASTWQTLTRVALPQALPRLIDGVRRSIGPAWVLLIAAEATSAQSGLGYRIFQLTPRPQMDVLLPYVAWISLLSLGGDTALGWMRRRAFGWSCPARDD